jgi:hypothetical protein
MPYTYKILMPPITKKLIDQFSEAVDSKEKKRKGMFGTVNKR